MIFEGIELTPVPGLEGILSVSRCGRVFAHRRLRDFMAEEDSNGYKRVGTTIEGRVCRFLVHRLVMLTFDPRPDSDDLDVNHKDFDRSHNDFDNLEWMTQLENNRYSADAGRHEMAGVANPKAKITDDDVREMRKRFADGATYRDLVALYPLDNTGVWRVITRRSWAHVQ